ncbi:GNAT family N-acetyltransferase [Pedobacter sp.]|uniref:GNAT family N-acetyltransferase n=1 Tax=Pedobacter sp. TaxID=1411316 RepID=UPI003BA94D38
MNLQVIPISNERAMAVIDIILPIQQKEFNVPVTLSDQPDLLNIEANYHQNGGCFWGAEIDGELVGTIALIKFDAHAGAIRKMFVKQAFRGKELGIAQKLLNTLTGYCRDNEIWNLYLGTVPVLQAAIRFYQKNDFVNIEKQNLPAAFPLMSVDTEFFTKNIQTL